MRRTVCLVLLLAAAGCGQQQHQQVSSGGPSSSSAPAATNIPSTETRNAPALSSKDGQLLATVKPARLPDTPAAVGSLLGRLPTTLQGAARTSITRQDVTWADGSTVTIAPLAEAALPGKSIRAFFTDFINHGQLTVSERSQPSAPLMWFVGTWTDTGHAAATFAYDQGHYLFGIEGSSPQARDELVTVLTGLVA